MDIKPQKFRIALVLNSLFFPFTFPDFIDSLRKRGYAIPTLPQSIPSGQKAYLGGYVAAKEDCVVELNPDKQLLAVEGFPGNNIKIIRELMSIAVDDFYVNLEEELDYTELSSHYLIKSDNNPLESIRKLKCESFDKFNKVLDAETAPYSVSIVPNGLSPNNKNWFDIRIEPRFTMPTHSYNIDVVYRNENYENVLSFSEVVNSKVYSLIEIIEEV